MFNIPLTRYRPQRSSDGSGGWSENYGDGLAFFAALTLHASEISATVERLEDVRVDDVLAVADESGGTEAFYRIIEDHRPPRARRRKLKLERMTEPIWPEPERICYAGTPLSYAGSELIA